MEYGNLLRRTDILGGAGGAGGDGGSLITTGGNDMMPPGGMPMQIRGPNGEIPNYIDPPTRVPLIFGVSISFLTLALIFVFMRLYSRAKLLKKFAAEEYLIAFSWVQAAFFVFVCCYSTTQGVGYHWWDVKPEVMMVVPKFPAQFVSTIVYTSVTSCIKISILIFYTRLTPDINFQRCVKFTIALVVLVFLYNIPANIFQCAPIRKAWDFAAEGKCINQMALWMTQSVFHVLTDCMIFVLPIPLIYRSKMNIRRKTQALCVFALGLILVIASVVKLENNAIGMTLTKEEMQDFGWEGANAMAWVTMEVNLGIIVACLPGIRPVLRIIFPRWFSEQSNASSSPGPSPIQFVGKSTGDISLTQISHVDLDSPSPAGSRERVGDEEMGRGPTPVEFTVIRRESPDPGSVSETSASGDEEKRRRRSFLDVLKDGRMIRMTLMKSKSGQNLRPTAGGSGESTQGIVPKGRVVEAER